MKKKIITLLTITIIITLSLIFEKNIKERYRVDTNNSFNKNNTKYINALMDNKQKLMQKFNLDSDTYNHLAELALGIA